MMLGYRPEKYSNRIKHNDLLKKGLGDGQCLYLNAGTPIIGVNTLGLSEWMEAIYNDFHNKGLEGTCSIYDAIHCCKCNIFTNFRSLTMEEVEKWAQDLIINGVNYPNPARPGYYMRVAPCPFGKATVVMEHKSSRIRSTLFFGLKLSTTLDVTQQDLSPSWLLPKLSIK
jgi:hypothetical protein